MSHLKTPLSALIIIFALTIAIPLAFATSKPKIDPYPEVIDATKIVITGKTEPNATLTIVGGPYELPPVKADTKGKFSVSLGLTQESENVFSIKATGKDGKASDPVKIVILESAEEAKKIEEEQDLDLTAPAEPKVDDIESPVDGDTYEITGTAEAKSTIKITGDDETQAIAKSDGSFKVKVYLKQNKENTFKLTAVDESGNVSPSVTIEIEEESQKEAEKKDDEKDDKKDDEKTEEKPDLTDVSGHWGENYINDLYKEGIISGYADKSFKPNNNITRAELTKIALLAFDYEISPRVEEKPFPDVELSAWYASYVQTAKKQKIVGGFEDNTFKPLDYITRDAALKILIGASGIDLGDIKTEDNFPDVPKDGWYAKYTAFAKAKKIVGGYQDGTFGAGNFITRAEVTKLAILLMELKQKILTTPTI